MRENKAKNPNSSFSRAIPIAGFNSARIVKGEIRMRYFPKRRENKDRTEIREIRRGVRDLPDRYIGMLLTITNNSANREVQREAERELRQRHHGKVIIEL